MRKRKSISGKPYNTEEIRIRKYLSHYGDILAKKGKTKDAVAAWSEALKYGDSDMDTVLRIKIENSKK